MKNFKEYLEEKSPPGKKAEEWIKSNKNDFKKQYGDDYEEVLYATAWEIFGEQIETIETDLFDSIISEEAASATTTTDGVANTDAKPIFTKSKFAGVDCLGVDDDTYTQCIKGKQPFKRWKGYVGDDNLRDELRSMYHKRQKLLIRNSRTGGMVYIK